VENPIKIDDFFGVPLFQETSIYVGWWFGTFFMTFHILGIILPTDEHIVQRG
jgi:hypothetical protein